MAILFDLDGVFYQGDKPIEGAAEVASWVSDNNIPHLFITNTSSRPRSALIDKLAKRQDTHHSTINGPIPNLVNTQRQII